MGAIDLTNLAIVVGAGFAAPLLAAGLSLPVPAVVLELLLGIVLGPSVLGLVTADDPVLVLATIGLGFVLFLAGLELEVDLLRGRLLRAALLGFATSIAVGLVVAYGLHRAGLVTTPLFVAIVLTATSLGVVVPVLKDASAIATPFGQLVVVSSSIADFGAIILLSLFYSREARGTATQVLLLGGLLVLAVCVAAALAGIARSVPLGTLLQRLQDTTAQIRVRGAFLLLVGLGAVASRLGVELILGAFIAGAMVSMLDQDRAMTHPAFRQKLEAAGYGVFAPVFFVTSGIRFDLDALTRSSSTLALVPVFLVALVVVRGASALIFRSSVSTLELGVAALLQATSLPFLVAATQIGLELGTISAGTAAALVGAGMLSVVCFPAIATALLVRRDGATPVGDPVPTSVERRPGDGRAARAEDRQA